jgi:hypothetical protein
MEVLDAERLFMSVQKREKDRLIAQQAEFDKASDMLNFIKRETCSELVIGTDSTSILPQLHP